MKSNVSDGSGVADLHDEGLDNSTAIGGNVSDSLELSLVFSLHFWVKTKVERKV